jgi:predicted lactoylglutathione lyase
MSQKIFVNLPVADLPRARAFYEAIGAANEPKFTSDQAACMVLSDTIFVMLLTHPFFQGFTDKKIADAHNSCQVLLCISRESREDVDSITSQALAAGGRETRPAQDMGMMYGRSFEDPDGHVWEPMWMDAQVASEEMSGTAAS